MVLPEYLKDRVRIHLDVPVIGIQDSGSMFGYRFPNVMGLLENRMNMLQPFEFATITGTPTASLSLMQNGTILAGGTITISVNSIPVIYTITSADASAPDPVLSIATNASNLISATLPSLVIASAQPTIVFPITTIGRSPSQWQVTLSSTNDSTFTVAISGSTGNPYAYVSLQGIMPKPSYTFVEDSYTATGYLPILDYLESKVAGSSDLMKFSKADVVDFRRDEMGARSGLYWWWKKRLSTVFGVPIRPLPMVGRFGGSGTNLRMTY
jgi:hypothetical protein